MGLVNFILLGCCHECEMRIREAEKNLKPQIIHYMLFVDGKKKYLCNRAVKPKDSKMTKDWASITCRNCLKQIAYWEDP